MRNILIVPVLFLITTSLLSAQSIDSPYNLNQAKQEVSNAVHFSLNNTLYPNSANTYDSLADGYAAKGDKEKAKANYLKAFQMNPKFTASKEKMEKL